MKSIVPSIATSATVWRSPMTPWFSIGCTFMETPGASAALLELNELLNSLLLLQSCRYAFKAYRMGLQPSCYTGPGSVKRLQRLNSVFEVLRSGVHGPDQRLVLEHEISHDFVRVDSGFGFSAGHASEDEDGVRPEQLEDVEGQLRSADCFVDHVHLSHLP